ncbi:MAG: hypothetical protein KY476_16805 [Planctomycetes bacterium]|nr:hypothetical protein [Planctomycetota bacterium]
MYAAPPPSGEVTGESAALGLQGLSIRFPALTIELPSLKLPGLIRYRRDAQMIFDESRAPYVYGPAAVYGQIAPGGQFAAGVPAGAPYAAGQPCSDRQDLSSFSKSYSESLDRELELREQLLERERRIRELESQVKKLQELEDCLKRLTAASSSRQYPQLSEAGSESLPVPPDVPSLDPAGYEKAVEDDRAIRPATLHHVQSASAAQEPAAEEAQSGGQAAALQEVPDETAAPAKRPLLQRIFNR